MRLRLIERRCCCCGVVQNKTFSALYVIFNKSVLKFIINALLCTYPICVYKLQVDHGQQRDSYERFTLKIQNWCKRQVHEEHLLSQRANEVCYDHTLAFRAHRKIPSKGSFFVAPHHALTRNKFTFIETNKRRNYAILSRQLGTNTYQSFWRYGNW